MGRSGIRRRKKKRRQVLHRGEAQSRDPDVIADLEDQAQWSSYTQHIPRLGNEFRERIRLARIYRFASGLADPTRTSLGRDWWLAIVVTVGIGLALGIAIWLLASVAREFL